MSRDTCPGCAKSWVGEKIPDSIAKHYSGTHWKREIYIDGGYMGIYDGAIAARCPDCFQEFPVSDSKFHLEKFKQYKGLFEEDHG